MAHDPHGEAPVRVDVALEVDGAALRRLWARHPARPGGRALMGRVAVLGSLNVDVVTLVERHPVPGRDGARRGRRHGSPGARVATRRPRPRAPARRRGCSRAVGDDDARRRLPLAASTASASTPRRCRERDGARPARRSSPSTSGRELDHRHRRRQRRARPSARRRGRTARPRRRAALLARGATSDRRRAPRAPPTAARCPGRPQPRAVCRPAARRHRARRPGRRQRVGDGALLADSDLVPRVAARDLRGSGARAGGRTASTAYPCAARRGRRHGRCRATRSAARSRRPWPAARTGRRPSRRPTPPAQPRCAGPAPSPTPPSDPQPQ